MTAHLMPIETPTRTQARPELLLVLGVLLTFLVHMRAPVGALAWIAPIPFLRWLRLRPGLRPRVALALALAIAWVGAVAKIATDPVPLAFAPLLGLPMAALHLLGFLAWDRLQARAGVLAPLAYATAMIVVEQIVALSPMASWGSAAHTQVDDLPLLQAASWIGATGLGFLVHASAAALEASHADARARGGPLMFGGIAPRALAVALVVVVLTLHAVGSLRLAAPTTSATLTVAAIGTTAPAGAVIPSETERRGIVDALIADTERAARGGARLVVWPEAAAIVPAEGEDELVERASIVARTSAVWVVIAYVVPGPQVFPYRNQLRVVDPTGRVRASYLKRHPAPGEPMIIGSDPMPVIELDGTRVGVAICYDLDYPETAAEAAALDVDVLAVPSSDWLGIDPVHTQMAAIRAIESGASIIRSTRYGVTAIFDPLGRARAWRSSFEGGDRVVLATIPAHGENVLRAPFESWPAWTALALWLALWAITELRARSRAARADTRPTA